MSAYYVEKKSGHPAAVFLLSRDIYELMVSVTLHSETKTYIDRGRVFATLKNLELGQSTLKTLKTLNLVNQP